MDEFLNNLSSPSWWVGVVFVGIVLHIAGDYINRGIDSFFSFLPSWWRQRVESALQLREKRLQYLINTPDERDFYIFQELRDRFESLSWLVGAVISSLLFLTFKGQHAPHWLGSVLLFASALALTFAISSSFSARYRNSIINELRQALGKNPEFKL